MTAAAWNIVGRDNSGTDSMGGEPLPLIDGERRMHVRAYNYWRARLDGRPMPRLSDCDDIEQSRFASRMALIDLARGDTPARVRSVGEGLEAGIAPAQRATRALFTELLRRLPIVTEHRAPVGFEADMPGIASADSAYSFRGILLPLADDSGELAYVLAVMNWRRASDEQPGDDVLAAVASVIGTENAPAIPAWNVEPGATVPAPDMPQRLSATRMWVALAKADRARAQWHLNAAVGALHDALQAEPADAADLVGEIFAGTVEVADHPQIVDVLKLASRLGLSGKILVAMLDKAEGFAGFLDAPRRLEEAMAVAMTTARGLRLTPLSDDPFASTKPEDHEDERRTAG